MNNFLRQHKKKSRFLQPKFITLVIFALLGISVQVFFPTTSARISHSIATPLWSFEQMTSNKLTNTSQSFVSKRQLILKNNTLKEKLENAQQKARSLYFLEKENRALKELLGRSTDEVFLTSAVLTHPGASPYDTIVIDAGSLDGIVGGEYVVVSDVVVGVVENVFTNTSVVTLFSTQSVETRVMLGDQYIEAVAIGRGGGNFIVELPREVGIEVGDDVIMPGINTKLFGIVEKVIIDPTQPFQKILFKNSVNIAELGWVNILKMRQAVPIKLKLESEIRKEEVKDISS